ncbi:phage tail protein [Pseudomonas reactans]|uniref:phage tail assembly chaperone n=1 Tax=Pseudomonas reactans TaxID=117680 RepID=UPI0015BBD5F6|nr:phage tail assembly chaperone [Pseudomonas reactans]NWD81902.1 phage tail protein [Pseudomonas reactans]
MKRFYSEITGNCYLQGIHTEIPKEAVEIDEDRYLAVIANPQPGKIRAHDSDGLPILIDPPPLTGLELSSQERQWRDFELSSVMWLRERHRDQQEIGIEVALSSEQFKELLVYMQALRDWPQSQHFPDNEHRPPAPPWIVDQQ